MLSYKTHMSNLMHFQNKMAYLFFLKNEAIRSESVNMYKNINYYYNINNNLTPP